MAELILEAKSTNQFEKIYQALEQATTPEQYEKILSGLDINSLNNDGDLTLLMAAAQRNNVRLINILIANGANKNSQNRLGATALHLAADQGHIDVIDALIKKKAPVDPRNIKNNTPLLFAASGGHTSTVTALIEAGAAPDSKNHWGNTALHVAAREGYTSIVITLLRARATLNSQGYEDNNAIHLAALNGHSGTIDVLIKANAKLGLTNKNGDTALHLAARGGHTSIVTALLRAGAASNSKDHENNNATHIAAFNGHVETMCVLIKANAKLELANKNGETALHFAVFKGNIDATNALIAARAPLGLRNNAGHTPLHLAIIHGNLREMNALIKAKSDVNALSDNFRNTPLMYAAAEGNVAAIPALLEAKANPNLTNAQGATVLAIAFNTPNNRDEVLFTLKQNLSKLNNQDSKKSSPHPGKNLKTKEETGHATTSTSASEPKKQKEKTKKNKADQKVPAVPEMIEFAVPTSAETTEPLLTEPSTPSDIKTTPEVLPKAAATNVNVSEALIQAPKPETPKKITPPPSKKPKNKFGRNLHHKHKTEKSLQSETNPPDDSDTIVASTLETLLPKENKAETPKNDSKFMPHDLDSSTVTVTLAPAITTLPEASISPKVAVPRTDLTEKLIYTAASKPEDAEAVKALLDAKANVNSTNPDQITPLFVAAQNGNLETVKLLLARKADTALSRKSDGATPLFMAAQQGNAEVVKWLIENTEREEIEKTLNATIDNGITPLFSAASHGSTEIVKLLTDAKADCNIEDETDSTALMVAIEEEHVDIVRLLLKAKGIHNIKNNEGQTALDLAFKQENAAILELFNSHLIERVIQQKGNIDREDIHGATPLIQFSLLGYMSCVELLLDAKADVNKQNVEGDTALIMAVFNGNVGLVDLLLKANANPNLINSHKDTALHMAIRAGHADIVKRLKKAIQSTAKTEQPDLKQPGILTGKSSPAPSAISASSARRGPPPGLSLPSTAAATASHATHGSSSIASRDNKQSGVLTGKNKASSALSAISASAVRRGPPPGLSLPSTVAATASRATHGSSSGDNKQQKPFNPTAILRRPTGLPPYNAAPTTSHALPTATFSSHVEQVSTFFGTMRNQKTRLEKILVSPPQISHDPDTSTKEFAKKLISAVEAINLDHVERILNDTLHPINFSYKKDGKNVWEIAKNLATTHPGEKSLAIFIRIDNAIRRKEKEKTQCAPTPSASGDF